jgi:hypothetical protein
MQEGSLDRWSEDQFVVRDLCLQLAEGLTLTRELNSHHKGILTASMG